MRLCSKDQNLYRFCRWCLDEFFGWEVGPFYPKKKKEAFWRRAAGAWRRCLWSSLTRAAGTPESVSCASWVWFEFLEFFVLFFWAMELALWLICGGLLRVVPVGALELVLVLAVVGHDGCVSFHWLWALVLRPELVLFLNLENPFFEKDIFSAFVESHKYSSYKGNKAKGVTCHDDARSGGQHRKLYLNTTTVIRFQQCLSPQPHLAWKPPALPGFCTACTAAIFSWSYFFNSGDHCRTNIASDRITSSGCKKNFFSITLFVSRSPKGPS